MPNIDFDLVAANLERFAALLAACAAAWQWVWKPVIKPMRDAAVVVRDRIDLVPQNSERIDMMMDAHAALTDLIAERHEAQDQILRRLDEGETRFDAIDTKLDHVIGQVTNGDETKNLPARIEDVCDLFRAHSSDDLANFRALGQWSKQFKDFTPFEPVAGDRPEPRS